jgi:outer membrane protein assembly factor BamB
VTNAHGRLAPLYAVRQSAEGEITPAGEATTSAGLAWSEPRAGAYMQTPIVYREQLYVCTDNGVLSSWEPRTGTMLWRERLGSGSSGFTASAIAADGKLYYTSELGEVHVVRAGPTFELLAVNALDEVAMATPAIAGGTLLWRTKGHLVAIDPPKAAPPPKAGDTKRQERPTSAVR